jgi:hypothetical protein
MLLTLLYTIGNLVLLVLVFALFGAAFSSVPDGGGYAIAGAIVLGYVLFLPMIVDRCRRD